MNSEDEFTPNVTSNIFGTSASRRRINFIPAGHQNADQNVPQSFKSVADQYLSIVLKDEKQIAAEVESLEPIEKQRSTVGGAARETQPLCDICHQPLQADQKKEEVSLENSHELSLAHQVCVHHSYPPSHLDRRRQGLKYLSSYGWDVDSRRGLGASGEGRRVPVKADVKNNTVGLGMKIPESKQKAQKLELLDAGKVRKKDKQDRKRSARLQEIFYRDEEVEKYLGHQA